MGVMFSQWPTFSKAGVPEALFTVLSPWLEAVGLMDGEPEHAPEGPWTH